VGGIKNGDLLERARGTIDVFVTRDRKLEKQHDLRAALRCGRHPGKI
jgi:hypothetical protein